MTESGYSGWSNYETWAVKLWLDNDEGSYTYMAERAAEVLADNTDDGKVDDDGFKRDFADYLKGYHEEEAPDLSGSVFSDLLNAALSEVDWYEIAAAYLEEAKEEAS
jgi:hypothetical protein